MDLIDDYLRQYKIPFAAFCLVMIFVGGLYFSLSNALEKEVYYDISAEEVKKVIESQNQIDTSTEGSVLVDIAGQVKNPSVLKLSKGICLMDAILAAGGFSEKADMYYVQRYLNLAVEIEDRQKIYIPSKEETRNDATWYGLSSSTQASQSKVNINTATIDQLKTLSGVGDATAQKIIDGRPYKSIESIMDVSGIGESTFAKIKESIQI